MSATNTIKISAIHEAAHCVIKWRLSVDFYDLPDGEAGFDLIAVRTPEQIATGPYIDAQGHAHSCSGISEMPCFHSGVGGLDDHVPEFAANRVRDKMGHDIVVMLAGPLAEAKALDCDVDTLFEHPKAGFHDHQRALKTLNLMNVPPPEQHSRLQLLPQNAERYISDPKVWRVIVTLADALLAHPAKQLTGRDALKVLMDSWQAAGE